MRFWNNLHQIRFWNNLHQVHLNQKTGKPNNLRFWEQSRICANGLLIKSSLSVFYFTSTVHGLLIKSSLCLLTLHPLFPIIIITHINTFKQSVKTFIILFTKVSIRILFGQKSIADPAEMGSTLHTSHLVTPIYLLKIKNMAVIQCGMKMGKLK